MTTQKTEPKPRSRKAPEGNCGRCGHHGPVPARGLCRPCYRFVSKHGNLKDWKASGKAEGYQEAPEDLRGKGEWIRNERGVLVFLKNKNFPDQEERIRLGQ